MQLENDYTQLAAERDQLKTDWEQQQDHIADIRQKVTLLQLSLKSHVLENTVKAAAAKDLMTQINDLLAMTEPPKLDKTNKHI